MKRERSYRFSRPKRYQSIRYRIAYIARSRAVQLELFVAALFVGCTCLSLLALYIFLTPAQYIWRLAGVRDLPWLRQ